MNEKIKGILYHCICLLVAGGIVIGFIHCKKYFFNDKVFLSGVIKNLEEKQVLLLQENCERTDTILLKADNSFTYRSPIANPSGVYILYIPQTAAQIYLYLRKGAHIRILFDAAQTSERPIIQGNVTDECEIVRKMNEDFICKDPENIARMSFSEYYNKVIKEYMEILSLLAKVKDREFAVFIKKELEARKDYRLYCYRASYKLYVSQERDVQDEMFWDFARKIDLNSMQNAQSGLTNLVLIWDMHEKKTEQSDINILYELRKRVSNQKVLDYLSEHYMVSSLINETSIEKLDKIYMLFIQTCKDKKKLRNIKKEYETTIKALQRFAKGKKLLDIEMEDRHGNIVHLSSLKGKIRYVDIWASWCGPCCYELAFLEKLAEKYKGNGRLEVIGLSIDNNKNVWLKKAAADRPGWKQYRVTEQSRKIIEEEYGIKAIPRFMLFDEDNKIIDLHAPAPSDESINAVFQKLLAQSENEN